MANPRPRGLGCCRSPATWPGPLQTPGATHPPGARVGPADTWTKTLRGHRYLILLLLLICGVIVQSIARRLIGVTVAAEMLVGVSLFAMVLVVFEGRRSRLVALWAWVVVVALATAQYTLPQALPTWLTILQKLLLMLFHGWAAALILRDVFRQARIGTDDVLGAVCGYLLAAGGWANLYSLVDILVPGSFTVSPDLLGQFADPQGRLALFGYFSLATITSVGYGDIAPLRGPMTAFAMLETVFGQFYIAVVVAQIVGMHLTQGPRGGG